ncbi:MAG: hypothetical protein ABIO88_10060 [Burkholderiaceae bacterium]
MNKKLIPAQRIYRWSTYAWATLVLAHLAINLVNWWKLPPSDEVYANGVGFQMIAFALDILPYWFGGLFIVLLLEFVVFGRKSRRHT